MTSVSDPGQPAQDAFVVAVNDHGQHALWRADSALPGGWRRQSATMSRRAWLDAVAAAWPDIAPARTGPDGARPVRPFVHEMVAEQASRRPDATAVIAAGARLTYRELDQSANRLARYLAGLGAGPETVIGVHLGRGAEAIRSLLSIMKAGCGYLPLDPSLPPDCLARMCAEARPAAILSERADEQLPVGGGRLVVTGALELARQPATPPEVGLHPDHLGYAIYTSGRTCSANCWPAPPRGSGAWSERATPRTAGSASPTPPPVTTWAACPATAWYRCPVTWPRPALACPPANSASSPAAPTSSITRARS